MGLIVANIIATTININTKPYRISVIGLGGIVQIIKQLLSTLMLLCSRLSKISIFKWGSACV